MGVIDLDARVKKLEAGGGGADPTVIDQLEAAVTALDETVNGNGTTDLGLVGDVAALQEDVATLQYEVEYSTTERVVGKWIDGRPIYKKTFDIGENTQISYSSWTTLSNATIDGFDGLIKVEGATETLGTCGPFLATTTGTGSEKTLQLQTPRNGNEAAVRYVTVWYLKTTT